MPLRAAAAEFGASFAMSFRRPGDLGNATTDFCLGDNQLRLAVVVVFGILQCRCNRVQVVAVDGDDVESVRLDRRAVFSLWVFSAIASRVTSLES